MSAPKGNKNRALRPEDRRKYTAIRLGKDEREFYMAMGGDKKKTATGIHRAYEILREDKTLAAAADISAQARTLVAFTEDGAQTLLVAEEGLQFAMLRGEVVIIFVSSLGDPVIAGWREIDSPERTSRIAENYHPFIRVSAVSQSVK